MGDARDSTRYPASRIVDDFASFTVCPECGCTDYEERTGASARFTHISDENPRREFACGMVVHRQTGPLAGIRPNGVGARNLPNHSHAEFGQLRGQVERLEDAIRWVLETVEELEGSWHDDLMERSGVTL